MSLAQATIAAWFTKIEKLQLCTKKQAVEDAQGEFCSLS